jgi:inner membrane protein
MDSITQAALGAAIGQAVLGKNKSWKPLAFGALVATIPDLDVLFYLFYDGFDMLRIHRGISHSILFSLVAAFPIAYGIGRTDWARQFRFRRLWIFTFLCLFTHILLDTFTSYGTQLLLPFSDARLGFDSINVVDPVYTLPLLIGSVVVMLIPSMRSKWRMRINTFGLVLSTTYLLLTLFVKHEITSRFESDLQANGVGYQKVLTMPVGAANLNWYGVAKTADGLFMKKYNLFSQNEADPVYFASNDQFLKGVNPEWVETMKWFSKGFYTVEQAGDTLRFYNLQVDMRGMVLDRNPPAPTKGYFQLVEHEDATFDYATGALK